MRKSFKYRLYPNKAQSVMMDRLLWSHRNLYNCALEHRKLVYRCTGRAIRYFDQSAEVKDIRRDDPDMAICNAKSCMLTLRRLDRAFQAFFRRVKAGQEPGYPRFKGRDRFDTIEFQHTDGAHLERNWLRIQSVGAIKVKLHRPTEGLIKTVSLKREANRWYAVVSCDLGDAIAVSEKTEAVGVDLGLSSFIVTSDGESIPTPQPFRSAEKRLRRAQRKISRCKRGSNRRRKQKMRVARLHQKVSNQRRDFHHKTAGALIGRYGTIVHEDLNVHGLARTHLAKSVHDAGWSQFVAILGHKAEGAGVQVVAVDCRNTTQACSDCGCLPDSPIGLGVRMYHCASCGFACDRDLNAARNILWRGHRHRALTPTMVGVVREALTLSG